MDMNFNFYRRDCVCVYALYLCIQGNSAVRYIDSLSIINVYVCIVRGQFVKTASNVTQWQPVALIITKSIVMHINQRYTELT